MSGRPAMSEKQLQAAVLQLARLCHWRCYHSWLSIKSEPGFPDLVLVRAGRCLVLELKSATGKLSPAQQEWLGALGAVPGVTCAVIRPVDWTEGRVERMLV